MNKRTRESGFISPQFLSILLFLSALAYGTGQFISVLIRIEKASRQFTTQQEAYNTIEKAVLTDLGNDSSPEADTITDPIWSWENREIDGYLVTVKSLSGFLNPNFIRKGLLETTELHALLLDDTTPEALQQYRYDHGLALTYEPYHDFFRKEDFNSFFTCYSFANVNLVDEFAFEKYVEAITGSSFTASALQQRLLENLKENKIVTAENLSSFLGADYDNLYPYVNAEPVLNINFTDARIVRAIVGYTPYKVSSPGPRAEELLALREGGITSPAQIKDTLGIDEKNPLICWFGCKTWFWKIEIKDSQNMYYFIICRLPSDKLTSTGKIFYRIIEQGFES